MWIDCCDWHLHKGIENLSRGSEVEVSLISVWEIFAPVPVNRGVGKEKGELSRLGRANNGNRMIAGCHKLP